MDGRRLYVPAGYPSLHAFCVEELRLSEDAAAKRIHAARAAREHPAIFAAVAEGRLHLSGVCLLAPHLTPGNAAELLAAAAWKSKDEIERLVAARFPRSEMLPLVEAVPGSPSREHAPGHVGEGDGQVTDLEHAPGHVEPPVRGGGARLGHVSPVAAQRFELRLTMGQEMHDKLCRAQELLSHQLPAGDVARVLEQALDVLIQRLEKRKFAAVARPRSARKDAGNPRTIPAHVRRAVWQRDGGQCTFMSETGRRCSARTFLEYDHVEPVARGGHATVEGIRLRCRAHNQYEAERVFGAEFMRHKRAQARERAHLARASNGRARAEDQATQRARDKAQEVIPWLRQLGIRADEARRAAERCESIPDAPLEERLRIALSCFGRGTTSGVSAATMPAG